MDVKKCDRCGIVYEKNNLNLVENNLNETPKDYDCTYGYSSEPFITGITIRSTCGCGKKFDLCDKCNLLLIDFLNIKTIKSSDNPPKDYTPPAFRPCSKKKWGGFVHTTKSI